MPLEENQNLANVCRKVPASASTELDGSCRLNKPYKGSENTQRNVLEGRSGSQTELLGELRLRAWKLDANPPTEAPRVTLDIESPLNMAHVNGFFKEQSPQPVQRRKGSARLTSSPIMRSGILSRSEQSASPEPTGWSAAIGHASTGKSGRVIERLQGDIDRLHREKQVIKFQLEEAEKANETLSTQNQQLQDRTSNFELSHEASDRQVARKERQLEDLVEELKREKSKTFQAEETARCAAASEEQWRAQARLAKSIASQKETEYDTIVSCRNRDNDRHQAGLTKMRQDFIALLRQREEDLEKHRKLELIAEQQRQTIGQLDGLTTRLNTNFKAYRAEIDTAIAHMREHASSNGLAVTSKLEEMTKVAGDMRWVMNMERVGSHHAEGPTKRR